MLHASSRPAAEEGSGAARRPMRGSIGARHGRSRAGSPTADCEAACGRADGYAHRCPEVSWHWTACIRRTRELASASTPCRRPRRLRSARLPSTRRSACTGTSKTRTQQLLRSDGHFLLSLKKSGKTAPMGCPNACPSSTARLTSVSRDVRASAFGLSVWRLVASLEVIRSASP